MLIKMLNNADADADKDDDGPVVDVDAYAPKDLE